MGKNKLNSPYSGSCFILATKHSKSLVIAPTFFSKLQASVIEYVFDTDQLGTFTGEIERSGNAVECARKKCEWSINKLGQKVEFALASEGSFGPHPLFPFSAIDHEVLYLIDRRNDFHLHLSHFSNKTNYKMESVSSIDDLNKFATDANFPSHGLILRPDNREIKKPIFKGITCIKDLEAAFYECYKLSSTFKVWVETDMRAIFNPSRMKVISELAEKFADRLLSYCPKCYLPGWGKVDHEIGLECSLCYMPTNMIKTEILGCVKCNYRENISRFDGLEKADPGNCQFCNP